jgi:hypothetical protein
MGPSKWPQLESYPDTIEEHASKLKEDTKGFDSFGAYNRAPVSTSTYRVLMRSLITLCDKILRQPTPTQLYESVQNVRILIQGIQTTAIKTHDSVQEIQKTVTYQLYCRRYFNRHENISFPEDEDEDDDISIDGEKDTEVATEAGVSEDLATADNTRKSFGTSTSSAVALRICDAKADASIEAPYEVGELPRKLLQFAQWALELTAFHSLNILSHS